MDWRNGCGQGQANTVHSGDGFLGVFIEGESNEQAHGGALAESCKVVSGYMCTPFAFFLGPCVLPVLGI